ncbi:hypothetical protein PR202_ga09058 [Eleusine coracana subsp. coracana]|uniref:Uncharacterized protein n=1 Tax=Eleusine coracana subsp. coracana TaxID=191504 RepID=A0AAV5C1U9_ELECO|nr:hypothetical protein PR202_ga09058 [Eleusine coracana subsp. coracana]
MRREQKKKNKAAPLLVLLLAYLLLCGAARDRPVPPPPPPPPNRSRPSPSRRAVRSSPTAPPRSSASLPLEAGAVEGLLACLENDNVLVVEAALGALCTLLDDRVDVKKSVVALVDLDAVRLMLGARQRAQNLLWQKCFCVVEKLLEHDDDQCMREVAGDRMLPTTLVSAFQGTRAPSRRPRASSGDCTRCLTTL